MSKQRKPVLTRNLDPTTIADLDDLDLNSVLIERSALPKQSSSRMHLDSARILDADWSETKVCSLTWLDVECDHSQLSLVEWPEAHLTRVVMRDSRATGMRLENAEFQDVRFVGCHLDYASFTRSKFRRVTFEQCRLRDADFGGADLEGTVFLECNLQGVTFIGAKLTGTDIATCSGKDIRIEALDVRGLIVSSQQAAAFAKLFGLVIRDARD